MASHYIPSVDLARLAYDETTSVIQKVTQRVCCTFNRNQDVERIRKILEDEFRGIIEMWSFRKASLELPELQLLDSERRFSKELGRTLAESLPFKSQKIIDAIQKEFFEYVAARDGKEYHPYGNLEVRSDGAYLRLSQEFQKKVQEM